MKYLIRACSLYLICWTFFPFMQVGTLYRLIAVACAAMWVLLALAKKPNFLNENLTFILISGLVICLMIAWYIFLGVGVTKAITQSLQFIIMVLIGLISLYVFKYDKDFAGWVFSFIMIALIVFCITTTYGVIENPYAARIANAEWLEDRFEGNEMVGLYGYVYMCVFIAPMLLYLIQKKVRLGKYTDFFLRLALIAIIIMVLCAGYMIAIFCTLGSCLFVWTFSQKNMYKRIVAVLVFLVFLFAYQAIVDFVFSALMDAFSDNPVYYTKFRDLRLLFLGGDVTGETVDGRFSNYADSWQNIVKYPFLGCYFYGKSGYGGGHSAILDMVGRFGIATAALYLYLILVSPHTIAGSHRKWDLLDYVVLICSIVFGLLDPVFQELSIAVYFIFPFIMQATRKQTEGALIR